MKVPIDFNAQYVMTIGGKAATGPETIAA